MITNGYISASLKQTNSYQTRFTCVDCLNEKKVKLKIYPKISSLFKTIVDNWWCISHFSLFRDFANGKGIFILESNFNRIGHITYINIAKKIKSIFELRQQLAVVTKMSPLTQIKTLLTSSACYDDITRKKLKVETDFLI